MATNAFVSEQIVANAEDEVIEIGGGIEKIRLLVTHRSNSLLQIVPGLIEMFGGSPKTQAVGISVIEPVNE